MVLSLSLDGGGIKRGECFYLLFVGFPRKDSIVLCPLYYGFKLEI